MPESEDLGQLCGDSAEDEDQHRHGAVEDLVCDSGHESTNISILVRVGLFRSIEVSEDFRPRQYLLAPESCDVLHSPERGGEEHIGESELLTAKVR